MTDDETSAQQPLSFDSATAKTWPTERAWALVGAYGPAVTRLCRAGPALLPGITGLGLSAGGPPHPRPPVRYSSDTTSSQIEALQYVHDEGPCRDVTAERRPLLATDLAATSWQRRWPRFTGGALAAGARALHALPLHAGGIQHPGALDMYRNAPGRWQDDHQAEATAFAAATAELLTLERLGLDLSAAFEAARRQESGPPAAPVPQDSALLIRWFGRTLLPALRRQVRTLCAAQGLQGHELHRFVLAVHAGLTNVVRHGGGLGQLLLWRAGRTLWCEIADHGPGIPHEALTAPHPPTPDADWTTGWGLSLIRRACTSFAVTTDGTGSRLLLGHRLS